MSSGNEALRKPQLVTPDTMEIVLDASSYAIGDHDTGLVVPADKFVLGAYISNPANDLAGNTGATLAVKVGSTAVTSATVFGTIKNSGIGAIDATPDYSATARKVYVTVATEAVTAGTLVVKVTYL